MMVKWMGEMDGRISSASSVLQKLILWTEGFFSFFFMAVQKLFKYQDMCSYGHMKKFQVGGNDKHSHVFSNPGCCVLSLVIKKNNNNSLTNTFVFLNYIIKDLFFIKNKKCNRKSININKIIVIILKIVQPYWYVLI